MSARIFLTGASGFLGSYVLRSFVTQDAFDVAVLLRDPDAAWRVKDVLGRARVVRGTLDDEATYAAGLAGFAPTHLVHLAWNGVGGAQRNDAAQYRNVGQSMRLLEAAKAAGAAHFVGLGSQAEYGPCAARIGEATPTTPTTMYGASKLATCLIAQRYCELNAMRFAWLRLFSSYGPRDNPAWMIPYLTRKLLGGERPAVTAAEQRWDYIYVEDAADAIAAVARTPAASGIFNLGSGTAPPLREVIEGIRREIDPGLPVGYGEVPYRPDQVMHLEADIGRLTAATGWRPKTSLADGLRNTVNWYRHHAGH